MPHPPTPSSRRRTPAWSSSAAAPRIARPTPGRRGRPSPTCPRAPTCAASGPSRRRRCTPTGPGRCCARPTPASLAGPARRRRQRRHRDRLRRRGAVPADHGPRRPAAAHRGRRRDRREHHGVDRAPVRRGLRDGHARRGGRRRRRDRRVRRRRAQLRAGGRRHRRLVPLRPARRPHARDRLRPGRPRAAGPDGRRRHDVGGDQRGRLVRPAGRVVRQRPDGYALDARGGLFRTTNGGGSWQPIDPGTTAAPRAVLATGDVVLLAGPRGVRRATGGGRFDLVAAGPARRAAVGRSTAPGPRSSPSARRRSCAAPIAAARGGPSPAPAAARAARRWRCARWT